MELGLIAKKMCSTHTRTQELLLPHRMYLYAMLKTIWRKTYIYIYIYTSSHRHHHLVVPPARISLTLSRHSSLSFITSGRSSELHPISSRSCCMYVRAGHPAFTQSCEGVDRKTSLMSSSLLLHHCPACLVFLILIFFVMGGTWPYSWCFVRCCL